MDLFEQLKNSSPSGLVSGKKQQLSSASDFISDQSTKSSENFVKKSASSPDEYSSNEQHYKTESEASEQENDDNSKHSAKTTNGDKIKSKSEIHAQKLAKFNDIHKSPPANSSTRRESMPSPTTQSLLSKSKNKKSRSLSPPKYGSNAALKSLKVKVERKNLDDFFKSYISPKPKLTKTKQEKQNGSNEPKQQYSLVKATPTKAQQKLFEPLGSKKSNNDQILKDFNIKKCAVRVRRDNFKKLIQEFKKRVRNKAGPKRSANLKAFGRTQKRHAETDDDETSPSKKTKFQVARKASFFIKFNSYKSERKPKPTRYYSSSTVAQHNKIRNSKSSGLTAPTKFPRSQLIRTFGNRFFTSFVRIEKCTHPLLLTFESNDRARRQQAKRNKSKNLSVSFREQVEVFGGSSDSDYSYDENFCVTPQNSGPKAGRRPTTTSVPLAAVPAATPVVMPARLKKVENGKVIDDIELDPSLFVDPKNLVASTPYSPGRKKRDHKSFSPLKDEGTPSPRKEQLKLANEKIPPSGLRRLNVDDDDDEDDDCEYIVPIELPQRRTSRANSTNTLDGGGPTTQEPSTSVDAEPLANNTDNCQNKPEGSETEANEAPIEIISEEESLPPPAATKSPPPPKADDAATPTAKEKEEETSQISALDVPNVADPETEPKPVITDSKNDSKNSSGKNDSGSVDSFRSAKDEICTSSDVENRSKLLSPTLAPNVVVDGVADTVKDSKCEMPQIQDVPELNGTVELIDDDEPMNLFAEDDSQQAGADDGPDKTFVESIINETIDKLGKDIDEGHPTDEVLTNST